jgi:CO dehydrogenase/acetyl-CoA synthase epsilon subunit
VPGYPKKNMPCVIFQCILLNILLHINEDYTQQSRAKGLDGCSILDVVLVTSYFNFVNRMVLSLGIELEEHKVKDININPTLSRPKTYFTALICNTASFTSVTGRLHTLS